MNKQNDRTRTCQLRANDEYLNSAEVSAQEADLPVLDLAARISHFPDSSAALLNLEFGCLLPV
jgi:hypothetical protein